MMAKKNSQNNFDSTFYNREKSIGSLDSKIGGNLDEYYPL